MSFSAGAARTGVHGLSEVAEAAAGRVFGNYGIVRTIGRDSFAIERQAARTARKPIGEGIKKFFNKMEFRVLKLSEKLYGTEARMFEHHIVTNPAIPVEAREHFRNIVLAQEKNLRRLDRYANDPNLVKVVEKSLDDLAKLKEEAIQMLRKGGYPID